MSVTKDERDSLPSSEFGLPKEKKYLLDTPGRARSALSYIRQNGTPTEVKQVQDRVKHKYPDMNVEKTGK